MTQVTKHQQTYSRRDVLRNGGTAAAILGLGIARIPGAATAANRAELVEAIASEAGISKADAKTALDALVDAITKALARGERVALSEFGLFTVANRVKNASATSSEGDSIVEFHACPELAAALDLNPGNGDERRAQAGSRCRTADVVVDADRIASDTKRGTDSGLSKADSKKALDAFIATITRALQTGDARTVVGFGSFSISKRSARTGRNPQTGKEIKSAAKNEVEFKAGAELSKSVN